MSVPVFEYRRRQSPAKYRARIDVGAMLAFVGHRRGADDGSNGRVAMHDVLSEIMVRTDERFADPKAISVRLVGQRRRRVQSRVRRSSAWHPHRRWAAGVST